MVANLHLGLAGSLSKRLARFDKHRGHSVNSFPLEGAREWDASTRDPDPLGMVRLPSQRSVPRRECSVVSRESVLCPIFQSQLIAKASLSQSRARDCRSLIASKGERSLHPNCGELIPALKN